MNIEEERKRRGVTQKEMASLLGVSVRTIQAYEQGLRVPSKPVVILLEALK